MQGYTVGVAGLTVNQMPFGSGSSTLSPCTIFINYIINKKTHTAIIISEVKTSTFFGFVGSNPISTHQLKYFMSGYASG